MKIITSLLLMLLLSGPVYCFAQESMEKAGSKKEEPKKGTHQLGLFISHSNVSEGKGENGGTDWLIVPSWSLDYNYWVGERWAVGLHTDMLVESFEVIDHNGEEENSTISRTRPVAVVPVFVFKPGSYGSFNAGVGGEFAKEGNFTITRLGYEYGWELPKHWELSAALTYDIKWKGYDIWSIGLGVSKSFGGRKKQAVINE